MIFLLPQSASRDKIKLHTIEHLVGDDSWRMALVSLVP
jgi:hypothetical protein